jgi:predicted cupin superfamily sugar epimerase
MHPRAQQLVDSLALQPHPEGGFYREIHRSTETVLRGSADRRAALTTIYYLLTAGEASAWHRVASDEVWHFYEGEPLELKIASQDARVLVAHRLGPLAAGCEPVCVVAAGEWQSARPFGAYTLVGCSVGPGFDFADFTLLRDLPEAESALRERLLALA